MYLFAQQGTLEGTLTELVTGYPVEACNISVQGTTLGTMTDQNGNYSIKLDPGKYTVQYMHVSYETVTLEVSITANQKTKRSVQLQETTFGDVVVVLGSRAKKPRTAMETAVPVDVIDVKDMISKTPQTSINEILNYVAPSFTSTAQTVSDGTDHIDPASLRGLGPDQVLVLINGKRRHSSSLVNINGTVGAGSVGTDMNSIPTAAIERIEVLRDGAAAQYGSDAISGVINIVLKKSHDELSMKINTGAHTSQHSNKYGEGGMDGERVQIDLNYGLPIGESGGFINFTGSMSTREHTNRSDDMGQPIYLGYNSVEWIAKQAGADLSNLSMADVQNYAQNVSHFSSELKSQIANAADMATLIDLLDDDVTDAELGVRGLSRENFRMKIGQSELREGKYFMNMELPTGDYSKIYAFGGISYREGLAAGFYRRPAYKDGRGNTAATINGFLPHIHSDIIDKSFSVGIKGKLKDWDTDLSTVWGSNKFDYTIQNTSNSTLGTSSPKEFNAGGFEFVQQTTNWDISRFHDDIFEGLNVAFGAEYRVENYRLFAGEEASYASYGSSGSVVTDPSKFVKSFYGQTVPGGSQVFPGYRPENEVDAYRNSYGLYTDIETDLTKQLMISAALRYENYSDFGNTLNWKLAGRAKINENMTLRGAASTGFRAPSLHQIHFSATSTQFVDGVPFEVGTFANNSRIANLLGIPQLKEENSRNYSAGLTFKIPDAGINVTIDAYQVEVDDRVIFTGSFSKPKETDNAELYRIFTDAGANKARFFANAIDTRSRGIDLVITHKMMNENMTLTNVFSSTFSKTEQVGTIHTTEKLKGLEDVYFDDRSRGFLETAMPRIKMNLSHTVVFGDITTMLRNTYFGEVTDPDAHKTVYDAKIITDITGTYSLLENVQLTVGVNNLLDIYPDEVPADQNYGRQFIFSRRTSQFGFNGRYLFSRINIDL